MTSTQLELDAQWLAHRPITGPRNGFIEEHVFVEKWLELMQREVEFSEVDEPPHRAKLARILINLSLPTIEQRVCTVAASWACYLGCNAGASVIDCGNSLRERIGNHSRFLAAWALHNKRSYCTNRGYRAIEYMLSPAENYNTSLFAFSGLLAAPDLSLADYEVVEQLWLWLGSDDGFDWLLECSAEIQRRQAAEWREHERRNRASVIGGVSI
jgi:hypothetical protein